MKNIIIFGYNYLGSSIAKSLKTSGNKVTIVDNNINGCRQAEMDGFEAFETNFTNDDEIVDWGIGIEAEYLFCVSDDEDLNLYLALTSRTISPTLFIIARAEDHESRNKLLLSGANETINLGEIGSEKIFSLISSPKLSLIVDSVLGHNNSFFFLERLTVETVEVVDGCFLDSNMLFSIDFKEMFDIVVLAINEPKPNSTPLFNIGGLNHFFRGGDKLIVMGKEENIQKMRNKIAEAI